MPTAQNVRVFTCDTSCSRHFVGAREACFLGNQGLFKFARTLNLAKLPGQTINVSHMIRIGQFDWITAEVGWRAESPRKIERAKKSQPLITRIHCTGKERRGDISVTLASCCPQSDFTPLWIIDKAARRYFQRKLDRYFGTVVSYPM